MVAVCRGAKCTSVVESIESLTLPVKWQFLAMFTELTLCTNADKTHQERR